MYDACFPFTRECSFCIPKNVFAIFFWDSCMKFLELYIYDVFIFLLYLKFVHDFSWSMSVSLNSIMILFKNKNIENL